MEKHHQTLSNQPATGYIALNTHTQLSNIYSSQLLMQVMIMLGKLLLTTLKKSAATPKACELHVISKGK